MLVIRGIIHRYFNMKFCNVYSFEQWSAIDFLTFKNIAIYTYPKLYSLYIIHSFKLTKLRLRLRLRFL